MIWRQIVVSILSILFSGCASIVSSTDGFLSATDKVLSSAEEIFSIQQQEKTYEIGAVVEGFLGGVAVDEPRAALVGREVLSAGGNAFDAATAIFFALSVTLPSTAGLAGGGVCAVHPAGDGKTEFLQFLPYPSNQSGGVSRRPSAVPGNPRGFFLLHSKYGRLSWSQLLVPAENLARFGYRTSRAFATQLARVAPALKADPEARKIFLNDKGEPVEEGQKVKQVDYANVLARIRTRGVGDFYIGSYSAAIVRAVNQAGGTLSEEDLRLFKPQWVDPLQVEGPHNTLVLFPPPPNAAGAIAAQISAIAQNLNVRTLSEIDRYHLLAEASKRVFSYRQRWMQPDGSSSLDHEEILSEQTIQTLAKSINLKKAISAESLSPIPIASPETSSSATFAVIDREGSAVACGVTMNNLFGTGKVAPGLGLLLAAAPDNKGRGYRALSPVLVVHKFKRAVFLAMSASGGVTLPTTLTNIIARVAFGDDNLEKAMQAPRIHHGGDPDVVFVEQKMNREIIDALRQRGHTVSVSTTLGRANAIFCSLGMPPPKKRSPDCSFFSDFRGHGLALGES